MRISTNTLLNTLTDPRSPPIGGASTSIDKLPTGATITAQTPATNAAVPAPAIEDPVLPISDLKVIATKVDYDPEESLKLFQAPLTMGKDMQDIAEALRRTMRAVIEDRPDLSLAKFDFVTDRGAIKVISDDLDKEDRNWLEKLLNKNTELVAALNGFQDRYNTLYNGATHRKLSAQTIAERTNKSVQFMSLLSELGSDTQRTLKRTDGIFQNLDGSALDLSKPADSAAGFLNYMEQMQKVQEGTITFTKRSGKIYYGAFRMSNPFIATGFKMANAIYSDVKSNSLGLHEQA